MSAKKKITKKAIKTVKPKKVKAVSKKPKTAKKKTKTTDKEKKAVIKTVKKPLSVKDITTENIHVIGKHDLISFFAQKDGDTGSPEVQIALATHKIYNLTHHLDQNPKDNHSRRGLLKIIAKRRRILTYLQSKDEMRYKDLLKKLSLKK